MARWLVEHVFGHDDQMSITLADVDPRVAGAVSSLNVQASVDHAVVSYEGGDIAGLDDPEIYDGVLLGVPIPAVAETVGALFPRLGGGTLVFDICSTKAEPLRIMSEAAAPRNLSVIGTHPLFGPTLTDMIGEVVVVCHTPVSNPHHVQWLTDLLREHGATVTHTADPQEHDRYMGYVQVLTHFVFMSFVQTMRTEQLDLARAWDYQTPPFRFLAGFAGRMLNLDSEARSRLYTDIQHSVVDPGVRATFVEEARKLAALFEQGDIESTQQGLAGIASALSPTDREHCQSITGTAIRAEQEVARSLDRFRRSGELCGLQIGRNVRAGIVQDVYGHTISFDDCLLPSHGEGPYGLQHTKDAIASAAEFGLRPIRRSAREVPRRTARLLSPDEFDAWLNQNLDRHQRSINVEVDQIADSQRIAEHLYRMVPGLLMCAARYEFALPNGRKRATLDLEIRGDVPSAEGVRRVQGALQDFGLRSG